MPDIRKARTVAAGATVTNLMAGDTFEFIGQQAMRFRFYAVQDGVNDDELAVDVNFSNAIVAKDLAIPVFTAGQGPNANEHRVCEGVARPGDRLVIQVKSTAAAATANLRWLVRLNAVSV